MYYGLYQFIIFKPFSAVILAAIQIAVWRHFHQDEPTRLDAANWVFRVVQVATLLWALYCVLMIWRGTLLLLLFFFFFFFFLCTLTQSARPVTMHLRTFGGAGAKIFWVKLLVAVTAIQRLILSAAENRHRLPHKDGLNQYQISLRIQHILISLEMVVFTVIFFFVFTAREVASFPPLGKELLPSGVVEVAPPVGAKLKAIFSVFDVIPAAGSDGILRAIRH